MEVINERIKVIVECGGGKIRPTGFEWRNREYVVESIPLVFERSDGGRKYLCFDVDVGGMMAELWWDLQNFQFTIYNFQPNV